MGLNMFFFRCTFSLLCVCVSWPLQAGTLSPRPDFAASRLRLSSAGSDVTIGTDASRPLQDSGATMVLTNFAEVGTAWLRERVEEGGRVRCVAYEGQR